MPRALPLGELAPQVTERARPLPEGVQSPAGCIQTDISICYIYRRATDISHGLNSHVFCTIDISVQTGQLHAGGERKQEKKNAEGEQQSVKFYRQSGKCSRNY